MSRLGSLLSVFFLRCKTMLSLTICLSILIGSFSPAFGGEELYKRLSQAVRNHEHGDIFRGLNTHSRLFDWDSAVASHFTGHLRLLEANEKSRDEDSSRIYLVRNVTGDLHILRIPQSNILAASADSPYHNLSDYMGKKLSFNVLQKEAVFDGETYSFVSFNEPPTQLVFDRIFKIAIVLMLFFVMVGMGLTLTLNDFRLVFKKPKAIIAGTGLQWVVMPIVAAAIGYFMGFYHAFPFIFAGMILITVSPGGVTSNLMTYYAKGDLALSVSLTSFSTVLSLFFTPFLLALFCANIEDVAIPVALVVQTIIILVVVPLAIGMSVRAFWMEFAKRATPFFSALGVIALLFMIIAGIIGNIEVFTDLERYGLRFYTMVLLLTFAGVLAGGVLPKILGINNYQIRAVSLETGLRNASLAMAIAILVQDHMGDFYGSMFITSAMFGLFMYAAGFIAISAYGKFLPIEKGTGLQES